MKKVEFMSRKDTENATPSADWAVISINGLDPARLQAGWNDVLYLEFDDVDVEEAPFILFNKVHALQIAEFIHTCDDGGVEGILVHCHAGISRSAAVAKWIAETYGLPFPSRCVLYNKHVYRVLRELDQPGY
jgi:hypothetical protein